MQRRIYEGRRGQQAHGFPCGGGGDSFARDVCQERSSHSHGRGGCHFGQMARGDKDGRDFHLMSPGFGRWRRGGGHGGQGMSDDDFNFPMEKRRRMGADDLQLVVLALIEEKPRHGYEIIKYLDTYTHGFYAPSPGMVYPVLTYLEESDLVSMSMEGNKKFYALTDQGKAFLNENREHVQMLMTRLSEFGQRMQRMRESFADDTRDVGSNELRETIHELRVALRGVRHATDEKKQRINAILLQALEEIKR